MMITLATLIIFSLLAKSSNQECGCCGLAKQLITDDDVYLEISANPLLEADPKVDRMDVEISDSNSDTWCSMIPLNGTAFDPYLTFEFNSLYLIEVVSISGVPDGGGGYVRSLTIQNNIGQGFTFISDNPGIPQIFNTSLTNTSDVRNISFMDRPVLATALQIKAYTWAGGYPCMRIELYGCLYDNNTDTDNYYPEERVLITLGIGSALLGSLVTIVIVLGIVCCCRQIKKRNLCLASKSKRRTSSMDSDATLRVVNNILYRKRHSDKRPLAPSSASTLMYETVPGQQDPNNKETMKPQDEKNMEEHHYEKEMPSKWQSAEATPIYEIQYEPVKIDEGLCVIQEEGEDLNDTEQCKLRETGGSNGTMCSNHSYEIIKDREDAILEASTESFLGNEQDRGMDDAQMKHRGGGLSSTEANRVGAEAAKKKYHGTKNVKYENVTIALSPDTRHALFCESSGPQHFEV